MAQPPQLAPMPHQIGIFDHCVGMQTETMVLREKVLSLTGDSFEIKLLNGTPILRVQGKLMSISGRKSVFDMAGNHLFDITRERFHIHTTFALEHPNGSKFMEVKSKFARRWPSSISCRTFFFFFLWLQFYRVEILSSPYNTNQPSWM
jgi:hypothetical protein